MKIPKKETMIVVIFVVTLLMTFTNIIVVAQVAIPSIGMPFIRLLALTGLFNDSIADHKAQVERLTMLASIPVGERSVIDVAGNLVNWDQAKVDLANTKIQEHYTRLADLGEGSWTYTYTPDVIVP